MEIIVVIGLVVVIGLTGGLFMTNRTIIGQELNRAYNLTRSEVARAQMDTLLGTGDSAWGVVISEHQIVRFRGNSYAMRLPAFDQTTNFPTGITLTGPSEINFTRPEGAPIAPVNINITDGVRTYNVSINSAGAISI